MISSREGSEKEEKGTGGGGGGSVVEQSRGTDLSDWWIFSIFSVKNDMMVLQKDVV